MQLFLALFPWFQWWISPHFFGGWCSHHEACLTVGEEAAGFFFQQNPTKRPSIFFLQTSSMLRPLVVGCSLGQWCYRRTPAFFPWVWNVFTATQTCRSHHMTTRQRRHHVVGRSPCPMRIIDLRLTKKVPLKGAGSVGLVAYPPWN